MWLPLNFEGFASSSLPLGVDFKSFNSISALDPLIEIGNA